MPDRPLGPPVTEPELYLILGVWRTVMADFGQTDFGQPTLANFGV